MPSKRKQRNLHYPFSISEMMPSENDESIDIEGSYYFEGHGHRGTVVIRSMGYTYSVHFIVNDLVRAGVGLQSGNVLSVLVTFPHVSTGLYRIDPESKTLSGRWFGFPAGGTVSEDVLSFSHSLKDDWRVGDRILGKWVSNDVWYPGVIRHVDTLVEAGPRYQVVFDDGDEDWLGISRMTEDLMSVGDFVQQPDRNGEQWRSCQIIRRDGNGLELREEDNGDIVQSRIDCIRTVAPREAEIGTRAPAA